MNEKIKEYRVYKIKSTNSDKYFIDYTKHKGYICMQLHNKISRYKKLGNNPEKYRAFFYIISKNDLIIEELIGLDTYDEARDYINEYKNNNEGVVSGLEVNEYSYNDDEIRCWKGKVDKKKYLKDYYVSNKEKYLERYRNNKDAILTKMKSKYVSKKKTAE